MIEADKGNANAMSTESINFPPKVVIDNEQDETTAEDLPKGCFFKDTPARGYALVRFNHPLVFLNQIDICVLVCSHSLLLLFTHVLLIFIYMTNLW